MRVYRRMARRERRKGAASVDSTGRRQVWLGTCRAVAVLVLLRPVSAARRMLRQSNTVVSSELVYTLLRCCKSGRNIRAHHKLITIRTPLRHVCPWQNTSQSPPCHHPVWLSIHSEGRMANWAVCWRMRPHLLRPSIWCDHRQ